ncbi:MAG: hypothetical protein P4M12_01815, partial [Gammaproteobacteria bacterium]|nr:hypothetical protein [Gammaproteobacteria bacterium]
MTRFRFVRFADWDTLLKPYFGDRARMQETIERLFAAPLRLVKKTFDLKTVYTHAFDVERGTHRLIFERIEHEKQVYYVLRSIAFHHEYKKALTWHPLTLDEISQLGQSTTITDIEQEVAIEEAEFQSS